MRDIKLTKVERARLQEAEKSVLMERLHRLVDREVSKWIKEHRKELISSIRKSFKEEVNLNLPKLVKETVQKIELFVP